MGYRQEVDAPMVWASCRQPFLGGSIVIDDRVNYSGECLLSELRGRHVMIQVHGVKNRMHQIKAAYEEVAMRSRDSFDGFVGFIWPGGATPIAYPLVSLLEWRQAVPHLRSVIEAVHAAGAASIDIDAHSLGVPVALAAVERSLVKVDGLWLKAGACPRDLGRYRELARTTTPIHVFYSRKDPIVRWLYRFWWPFRGALGALGEHTPKGGNVGTNHDCSSEVGRGHTGYKRSSIVVQAQTNEMERRRRGHR